MLVFKDCNRLIAGVKQSQNMVLILAKPWPKYSVNTLTLQQGLAVLAILLVSRTEVVWRPSTVAEERAEGGLSLGLEQDAKFSQSQS